MLDSEIVAAIVAGDADGLAAAYDRYAAPLYAFCRSLLAGSADAADVVLDTFIIARAALGRLRDPDLLRPWLYAVARSECHRRLGTQDEAPGPPAAAGPGDGMFDLGAGLQRAAPGELAGAAIAELSPAQREIAELSLRHDFDGDDLAATLGVPANRARALASRARGQVENLLGVLLVARSGRLSCRRLDEMIESHGDRLTGPARSRLSRHIRRCRACSGRVRRELGPALQSGVLPATAIARGLRPQVLGLLASGAPDAVAYRDGVVRRSGPFRESGFPAAADQPPAGRPVRPAVLAVAAAAVFAGLCAAALAFGAQHGHGPRPAVAAPAGRAALASPPRSAGRSGRARPGRASPPARPASPLVTVSATPTISATPPVRPAGTPAGGTSRPAPAPGTSGPASTPPSAPSTPPPSSTPGTLSVSPASVTLGPFPGGGAASGSFTLTASGGTVSYTISVPPAYAGELTVAPASGSLASGASVTISVTWNSSAALLTGLTVDPGGQTVTVSYQPPTASPSTSPAAGPRSRS